VVALGRITGFRRVRFWRGESEHWTRIRWYRVPKDRPCLPIPHCFEDPLQLDSEAQRELADDEVGVDPAQLGGDPGRPPGWEAPGSYCGSDEAWLGGGRRGVDEPLEWTGWEISTCCGEEIVMGTANTIAKFGPGGNTVVDSRIRDSGAGSVQFAAPILVSDYLALRYSGTVSPAFQVTADVLSSTDTRVDLLFPPRGPSAVAQGRITAYVGFGFVRYDFAADASGTPVTLSVNGIPGFTGVHEGMEYVGGVAVGPVP
jgi:hypothetical protein